MVEELAALLSFLLPFLSLSSILGGFTPRLLLAHTTCSVFSLGRLFFYIFFFRVSCCAKSPPWEVELTDTHIYTPASQSVDNTASIHAPASFFSSWKKPQTCTATTTTTIIIKPSFLARLFLCVATRLRTHIPFLELAGPTLFQLKIPPAS